MARDAYRKSDDIFVSVSSPDILSGYDVSFLPFSRMSAEDQSHSVEDALIEEIRHRDFELQILNDISQQLSFTRNYEQLITVMLANLHTVLPGNVYAGLIETDQHAYDLIMRSTHPLSADVQQQVTDLMCSTYVQLGGTPRQSETLAPQTEVFEDNPGQQATITTPLESIFQVPIISTNGPVGLLFIGAVEPDVFREKHIHVIYAAAGQAAGAIEKLHYLLNAEQQQLENIVANLPDGVVVLDINKSVVFINPRGRELLQHLTPVDVGATLHRLDGHRIEDLVTPADQPMRWVEVSTGSDMTCEVGVKRIAEGSQAGGYQVVIHDITELNLVQRELKKALDQERELGLLKSRFITMTSHEFRTPLTTILSSAEILRSHLEKLSPEKRDRHFEKIAASVRHMTGLLEEVLFIGRAETGHVPFHPVYLDLEELLDNILQDIAEGQHYSHPIVARFSGRCSQVYADGKLLRHIVNNLMSNAVKYSPHGSTIICLTTCTPEAIQIQITDEGMGIPYDDQKHIFEAFHRASNVTNIQGTGLGLAITHKCVTIHGGDIAFESQPGVGTTFTLTIPNKAPR